jgi:error-prone DNA polymerase
VTPRNGQGTQLALALELPPPPDLRPLADWDRLVADYATTGVALEHHPMELLRAELRERGVVSCRELDTLPHGTHVRIGGLVMARQRPGTAKGVTFLLLEDEFGTINLIVPPPIYERHRLVVRSEPLVVADGILERFASAGGAINIIVRSIKTLEAPDRAAGDVVELEPAGASGKVGGVPDAAREFPPYDSLELARRRAERAAEREAAEQEAVAAGGSARQAAAARGRGDFRAVAPPVLSFASGRRR